MRSKRTQSKKAKPSLYKILNDGSVVIADVDFLRIQARMRRAEARLKAVRRLAARTIAPTRAEIVAAVASDMRRAER